MKFLVLFIVVGMLVLTIAQGLHTAPTQTPKATPDPHVCRPLKKSYIAANRWGKQMTVTSECRWAADWTVVNGEWRTK